MKNLITILCLCLFWGSCESPTEPSYDCDGFIDEICGECSVHLWGPTIDGIYTMECYDIETTTNLLLNSNELLGEIPLEIGKLINLTYLSLWGK